MENFLSDKELHKQEAITKKRLKNLVAQKKITNEDLLSERPKESLIQLMNWASCIVNSYNNVYAKKPTDYIKVNNSKITIDGSFFQFCDEKKISVSCIFSDALSSWKTEYKDEHFLSTGIFEIKANGFLFYHCALFHKGTKNEDEVSFFILVESGDYFKYVSLRNEFSEWCKKRNRDIAEIEVVGGDPVFYTRDLTWDDICLEDSVKESVINSVDSFLGNKELFHKMHVPWKYGSVWWGPQGCGKTLGLKILMSVYKDLKPVTIIPGGHNDGDALLEAAFTYAQEHAPALLFFEDVQEMLREISPRNFLQLLDGVQGRDGVFIVATGNDLNSLEKNIINRPRRFDKKIEFPLPNEKMSKKYLSKYFSSVLDEQDLVKLSKTASKHKFTYSHLQDVYFNAVFSAVRNNRENPIKDDIDIAILEAIKDMKHADEGFVSQGVVKRSLINYDD